MWRCPVCEKENAGLQCSGCGFDGSCDYEQYPSLGMISPGVDAISRRRDAIREKEQNTLRCPSCGSGLFRLDMEKRSCICTGCGCRFDWPENPEKKDTLKRKTAEIQSKVQKTDLSFCNLAHRLPKWPEQKKEAKGKILNFNESIILAGVVLVGIAMIFLLVYQEFRPDVTTGPVFWIEFISLSLCELVLLHYLKNPKTNDKTKDEVKEIHFFKRKECGQKNKQISQQKEQRSQRGKLETTTLWLGWICVPWLLIACVTDFFGHAGMPYLYILGILPIFMQIHLWKKGFSCPRWLQWMWEWWSFELTGELSLDIIIVLVDVFIILIVDMLKFSYFACVFFVAPLSVWVTFLESGNFPDLMLPLASLYIALWHIGNLMNRE